MKKNRLNKWYVLPVILVTLISMFIVALTLGNFYDSETSSGNTAAGWVSSQWTQTSQADFNAGVLNNVDTATSAGDVLLSVTTTSYPPTANTGNWTDPANAYSSNNLYATFTPVVSLTTNSPTADTGAAWTNPANAYGNGTGYANITSGTPSGSNVWGTYGFSLAGNDITKVRVRYDAWSAGYTTSPLTTAVVRPAGNDANTGGFTFSSGTLYGSAGDNSDATYITGVTDSGGYCTFTYPAFSVPAGSTNISLNVVFRFRSAAATGNNGDARVKVGGIYYASNTSIPNRSNQAILEITNTWATNPKSSANWTAAEINGTDGTNPLQAFGVGGTDFNPDVRFFDVWAYVTYTPPVEYDDEIRVDVSWDGGTSWSSTQNTALTSTETTYWYDVTSATAWDANKLNDTNFKIRALAYTQGGGAEEIRLDWLPVEVTYTTDSSTFSHTYTTYGIDMNGYLISTVEVGIEAYAASSDKVQLEVTWDGGTSWSTKQTSAALPGSDPDAITWFDFSTATTWTPVTLNDTNFQVRIWYYGSGGQLSLDYLPVRVTGRAVSGMIASQVFDTTVTGASWDGLFWDSVLPAGTGITLETRSSDTPFLKTDASPSWVSLGSVSPSVSTTTNSPTVNSGSAWTDPANAYADDTSYAIITSGNPSGSDIWGNYGFDLSGSTITQVRVRYDAWHGTLGLVNTWMNSTSDTANGWADSTLAYDGDTGTGASISVAGSSTSTYLEMNIDAIECDKVRVWSGRSGTRIDTIDVDVYFNAQWNNIYSGLLTVDSYQEYPIGNTQTVTGMRIRYTSSANPAQTAYVYEAQFNSLGTGSAPQIKIDVSWDGGSSWSATQDTTLTDSEATYWYDVTSATTWDGTRLNDTNLKVRALAQTVNGDVEVRMDWIAVEVSYASSGGLGSISISNGDGMYKQWRAILTTDNAGNTPALEEVRLYYQGP